MRKLLNTATIAGIGLVAAGLLALQSPTVSATPDTEFSKREEDVPQLVLVGDDDDDDTNDDDDGDDDQTGTRDTGQSRSTRDGTRSNFTGVSRDRDRSRSDKTRDWTRDGAGDRKRDWSANRTNDRSRNDTRG